MPQKGAPALLRAAALVWDYGSWDVLSARLVTLAREAGALSAMPIALNIRALPQLLAGEFAAAASLVAQVEAVTEATGSSIAPYAALMLAVLRGRETEAAELIEAGMKEAERRREGEWLTFAQWVTAVLHQKGRLYVGTYNAGTASFRLEADQLRGDGQDPLPGYVNPAGLFALGEGNLAIARGCE